MSLLGAVKPKFLYPDWVSGLVTDRYQPGAQLLALPVRLALLGEGRRPLDGVLGAEDLLEELLLPLPELGVGLCEPVDENGLRRSQGQRRVGGDLLGQGERLLDGAACVSQSVDQTDAMPLLAADRLAGEGEQRRLAEPDPPGQA